MEKTGRQNLLGDSGNAVKARKATLMRLPALDRFSSWPQLAFWGHSGAHALRNVLQLPITARPVLL